MNRLSEEQVLFQDALFRMSITPPGRFAQEPAPPRADYAKAVPDGAGSVAGMAQDPVATAASNNPLLSTLVTAVTSIDSNLLASNPNLEFLSMRNTFVRASTIPATSSATRPSCRRSKVWIAGRNPGSSTKRPRPALWPSG